MPRSTSRVNVDLKVRPLESLNLVDEMQLVGHDVVTLLLVVDFDDQQ